MYSLYHFAKHKHTRNIVLASLLPFLSGYAVANIEQPASSGLSAALQATLKHHPSVQAAKSELRVHEHGIDSAKAGRLPSLSLQANTLTKGYTQGTLTVQQPLWAFGKIDNEIELSQVNYRTEQYNVLKVQRQLLEDTAVAYAKVEGVSQRLQVTDQNIEEHERLHQRVERRRQGQLASEADVNIAYSRLIQAYAQRERVRAELQVALSELQALTQVKVDANLAVSEQLELSPINTAFNTKQLAKTASANVAYQRERLNVVQLGVNKEKISIMPTLFFRVEQELLDTPSNTDKTRAGLVLQANLEGLGFAHQGRTKSALARLDAAEQDLDVTSNELERKINTLILNRDLQLKLQTSQQKAVEAIQATLDSFLRQYETGRKSWVEVLNTQRDLTEQRLQQSQINNEWLVFSLRIKAITGQLDSLAGIEAL